MSLCFFNLYFLFDFFVGSDYLEIVDLSITFEASEVEKRVAIQTNEDSVVEGEEEFTAVLTPLSDRISIAADTVHISIAETTNGTISL